MSADLNTKLEPQTPIPKAQSFYAITDPPSASSTLTWLSSSSPGKGEFGSPSQNLSNPFKPGGIAGNFTFELSQAEPVTTPVPMIGSFGEGDASNATMLKELLTPQKALPSKMKFIPDDSPSGSKPRDGFGHPAQQHPGSEEGGSSSEQEVWVKDFDLDLDWSQDEHEELMHCLKEEGLLKCMDEYINERQYSISRLLRAFGKSIPKQPTTTEEQIDKLQSVMRQALRNRSRIENYSTISDAVKLIWRAQKIMIVTGAGISVSCGVPDFRSPDGIYAKIKASGQYDDLEDPQEMFSIKEFVKRPSMFYSFIGQLWPQNVHPSISHEFIKYLETKKKLLRNYTQNIDSLEVEAGVERVFHCHGSFATAKCMNCQLVVPGSAIRDEVLKGNVPRCEICVQKAQMEAKSLPKKKSKVVKKKKKSTSTKAWENDESDEEAVGSDIVGLMKPDITFFGEKLSDSFDNQLYLDRDDVDLLLIMGTSLKVKPVSEILAHIPHSIPQILINKTPVEHANTDIVLLGDCDRIIEHLCSELEWVLPSKMEERVQGRRKRNSESPAEDRPRRLGTSHVWLFEGAKIPMAYARKHDPSFTRERKNKRARLN